MASVLRTRPLLHEVEFYGNNNISEIESVPSRASRRHPGQPSFAQGHGIESLAVVAIAGTKDQWWLFVRGY